MTPATLMTVDDLMPGVRIIGHREHEDRGGEFMEVVSVVVVEILRDREDYTDIFGRVLGKWWARRSDTGAEGYVIYGPGAYIEAAP